MGRKKCVRKREITPDPKFNDVVVARLINKILKQGKKSKAEKIFYSALDLAQKKTGEEGLALFKKALENIKPLLVTKSTRVGGANYQVPIPVKPVRQQSLAANWMIEAALARPEHSMIERLAKEIMEAASGRGGAVKIRDDMHKVAEANKPFAHFSR